MLAGLLLHALERWQAYYSLRLPNKEKKIGKLLTGQKAMGQLTETPSHAWPRVHPKR